MEPPIAFSSSTGNTEGPRTSDTSLAPNEAALLLKFYSEDGSEDAVSWVCWRSFSALNAARILPPFLRTIMLTKTAIV